MPCSMPSVRRVGCPSRDSVHSAQYDPMRARSGAPGALLALDGRLVVFYGTRTSRAMAAFDMRLGTRIFDVDLDATRFDARSASLGRDRIWIERGHVLDGYDATTGVRVLRIGHD